MGLFIAVGSAGAIELSQISILQGAIQILVGVALIRLAQRGEIKR